MVQHNNKKEAMWWEGQKGTGTFYLKAINHSCCFFSWEENKHGTHHAAVGAAFPASRMTDRVKAVRTDS